MGKQKKSKKEISRKESSNKEISNKEINAQKSIEINSFKDYQSKEYIIAVILFFVTAIIPLIVRYIDVPVGPEELAYVRSETTWKDFFSYYKSLFLIISAGVLFVYYLLYYLTYPRRFDYKAVMRDPVAVASAVYVIAVVLSSIFSDFSYVAVNGITERYESIFVLLAYIIIMFAVVDFAESRFQYKIVLSGLLFSGLVIGIIGVFQCFKMDIYNTGLMDKLVLGAHSKDASVKGLFDIVYATLYNPNSAGLYTVLLFPITFFTGLFYKDNIIVRILLICTGVLLLVSLIGTNSVGGFAALIVVVAVVLVTGSVYLLKNKGAVSKGLILACIGVAVVFISCALFVKPVNDRLMRLIDKSMNLQSTSTPYFYKDIYIEGDTAYITTASGEIALTLDHDEYAMVVYKDGNKVEPVSTGFSEDGLMKASYDVPGFGAFDIVSNESIAAFQMAGSGYMFYLDSNPGELLMISSRGFYVDITREVGSFGFEGMERFGSSRGYIWSRSIPLIKNNILIGAGPDAFILSFPQTDIVGKTRYLGDPYMIVDKPHNFYLQTAINTGLVSLLALLVLFGFYICRTFWDIINAKNTDGFTFGLQLGVMAGVCGYLTAAAATDSVVSVAPVFWAVLGLGIALLRNKNKKQG